MIDKYGKGERNYEKYGKDSKKTMKKVRKRLLEKWMNERGKWRISDKKRKRMLIKMNDVKKQLNNWDTENWWDMKTRDWEIGLTGKKKQI